MTKSAPVDSLSESTARAIGSVPSLASGLPRLIETTSARPAPHSIPSMIQDSAPEPASLRTLPIARSAPGATPFSFPSEAAPVPATVEATWVPWPLTSVTVSPGTKLRVSATCSARSGWVWSTPVSSTATVTPVPSRPCCHASGAPT